MRPLSKFIAALSQFLLFISFGNATVTLYIRNKCPFPIWPATAPNNGFSVLADGGFLLPSGKTRRVTAPPKWSGRLWARTGCDFDSDSDSDSTSKCQTGDCGGRLQCNGLAGAPPATLFQISVQSDPTKLNFYDVSVVDGYNLPVSVTARSNGSKCAIIGGCVKNLLNGAVCPGELRVLSSSGGATVACKSACLAFDADAFCCRNEFGRPETCGPSVYSNIFKKACPSYYSYAFDSPAPLVSCGAKDYAVTFCPSGWGRRGGDGNPTVGIDEAR